MASAAIDNTEEAKEAVNTLVVSTVSENSKVFQEQQQVLSTMWQQLDSDDEGFFSAPCVESTAESENLSDRDNELNDIFERLGQLRSADDDAREEKDDAPDQELTDMTNTVVQAMLLARAKEIADQYTADGQVIPLRLQTLLDTFPQQIGKQQSPSQHMMLYLGATGGEFDLDEPHVMRQVADRMTAIVEKRFDVETQRRDILNDGELSEEERVKNLQSLELALSHAVFLATINCMHQLGLFDKNFQIQLLEEEDRQKVTLDTFLTDYVGTKAEENNYHILKPNQPFSLNALNFSALVKACHKDNNFYRRRSRYIQAFHKAVPKITKTTKLKRFFNVFINWIYLKLRKVKQGQGNGLRNASWASREQQASHLFQHTADSQSKRLTRTHQTLLEQLENAHESLTKHETKLTNVDKTLSQLQGNAESKLSEVETLKSTAEEKSVESRVEEQKLDIPTERNIPAALRSLEDYAQRLTLQQQALEIDIAALQGLCVQGNTAQEKIEEIKTALQDQLKELQPVVTTVEAEREALQQKLEAFSKNAWQGTEKLNIFPTVFEEKKDKDLDKETVEAGLDETKEETSEDKLREKLFLSEVGETLENVQRQITSCKGKMEPIQEKLSQISRHKSSVTQRIERLSEDTETSQEKLDANREEKLSLDKQIKYLKGLTVLQEQHQQIACHPKCDTVLERFAQLNMSFQKLWQSSEAALKADILADFSTFEQTLKTLEKGYQTLFVSLTQPSLSPSSTAQSSSAKATRLLLASPSISTPTTVSEEKTSRVETCLAEGGFSKLWSELGETYSQETNPMTEEMLTALLAKTYRAVVYIYHANAKTMLSDDDESETLASHQVQSLQARIKGFLERHYQQISTEEDASAADGLYQAWLLLNKFALVRTTDSIKHFDQFVLTGEYRQTLDQHEVEQVGGLSGDLSSIDKRVRCATMIGAYLDVGRDPKNLQKLYSQIDADKSVFNDSLDKLLGITSPGNKRFADIAPNRATIYSVAFLPQAFALMKAVQAKDLNLEQLKASYLRVFIPDAFFDGSAMSEQAMRDALLEMAETQINVMYEHQMKQGSVYEKGGITIPVTFWHVIHGLKADTKKIIQQNAGQYPMLFELLKLPKPGQVETTCILPHARLVYEQTITLLPPNEVDNAASDLAKAYLFKKKTQEEENFLESVSASLIKVFASDDTKAEEPVVRSRFLDDTLQSELLQRQVKAKYLCELYGKLYNRLSGPDSVYYSANSSDGLSGKVAWLQAIRKAMNIIALFETTSEDYIKLNLSKEQRQQFGVCADNLLDKLIHILEQHLAQPVCTRHTIKTWVTEYTPKSKFEEFRQLACSYLTDPVLMQGCSFEKGIITDDFKPSVFFQRYHTSLQDLDRRFPNKRVHSSPEIYLTEIVTAKTSGGIRPKSTS